ncbi:MAG TPA: ATP-binding protein, partial [Acidimicrobiales bacterium]|nr:ATP-binding protein [Acidimicrobiales bacterium]
MAQLYKPEPALGGGSAPLRLGDPMPEDRAEWVTIGRLAELGPRREVRLDLTREHVLAIVGKRGAGKSFTLGAFLEGLCTATPATAINRISQQRAALLFDVLNIFQWMVAPVREREGGSAHIAEQARLLRQWGGPIEVDLAVDLWVPAGYQDRVTGRANAFSIRPGDMDVGDWASLLHVDAMQDVMGQLLSAVVDKVSRRGWVHGGAAVAPEPDYDVADLLACLAGDDDIQQDYQRETLRALRQRLGSYEASPLFDRQGTQLNDLLHPGRLSVMLLSGVPDDIRLVVIFLLIRQLLFARAAASEAAKSVELGFGDDLDERGRLEAVLRGAPPRTWVVVDEAQNIFPSERQTAASSILLRFVREGRNFGLSLGFTTQQPSAIDSRVMAQVDTLIAHTLTVQKDIVNVLANLKS